MFGTIVTNPKALSQEEMDRYGAYYCGLCQQLDAGFGGVGVATLTFDMTFLALLLSALYRLPEREGLRRCVPHPIRKHATVVTAATAYAADMNILLAYYQSLDDWNDDRNLAAREKSRRLAPLLPDIIARWPHQGDAVESGLAALGQMERAGELNPDLPTNCFGRLMGALFLWRQDDAYTAPLMRMGAALGRFIYLLDAVNDLRADIRHQRYNPLVAQLDTDFEPVLTLMMAECTAEFEKLPIERDAHLLQNILYSGVWQNYRAQKQEGGDAQDG